MGMIKMNEKLENLWVKKKKLLSILLLLVIFLMLCFVMVKQKEKRQRKVEKEIAFLENIDVEVYSDVTLQDVIARDQIEIISNFKIDTQKLGIQKIKFKYMYNNEKFSKKINVNIVDTTSPTIFANSSYTVTKGSTRDFVNYILSGDNYDDKPIRKIIGNYDLNQVGDYPVTYYMKDSSGNEARRQFTIKVIEKQNGSSSSSSSNPSRIMFSDVREEHKKANTEIGIDVSKWQGDIDFVKVKEAGCDFVIIRLGYQTEIAGELKLDPYYEQNIKMAKEAGLKVGVYLYTYAKDEKDALQQADWVFQQIKPYDLELGVSYDWESWTSFNKLQLSYHNFTDLATTFINRLNEYGYDGMLYSSKYYLENIWTSNNNVVWLAHYTNKTDYQGDYRLWQRTNNGSINGINGAVDIDILYK